MTVSWTLITDGCVPNLSLIASEIFKAYTKFSIKSLTCHIINEIFQDMNLKQFSSQNDP